MIRVSSLCVHVRTLNRTRSGINGSSPCSPQEQRAHPLLSFVFISGSNVAQNTQSGIVFACYHSLYNTPPPPPTPSSINITLLNSYLIISYHVIPYPIAKNNVFSSLADLDHFPVWPICPIGPIWAKIYFYLLSQHHVPKSQTRFLCNIKFDP